MAAMEMPPVPFDLPPPPTTAETVSFVACLFGVCAAVVMFRGDPVFSAMLGGVSAVVGGKLLMRRRGRRRKADGRPQPDDDFIRTHGWYEPDPADFVAADDPSCRRSCSSGCGSGQARPSQASVIGFAEARARLRPPDGSTGGP